MCSDISTPKKEPCCKIGTVSRDYDLAGLIDELDHRWGKPGTESASLRELQRSVNRRILRAALRDNGMTPIEGELENYRRLLSDSDVSENRRITAIRRLENEGLAVENILDDFVSHQTIYNHLRNCRDITPARDETPETQLSQAESTIYGLLNRTELVTAQTLQRLASNDILCGDFDIVIDMQVICEDCGRTHDVSTLLTEGECVCGGNASSGK